MTTLTSLKLALKKGEFDFENAMDGLITFTQYQVLSAVRSAPSAPSQFRLVEITGIDRSTLSDVVRRLVQKRLLNRRRNKTDARAWELFVTEAGLEILVTADKRIRPIERGLKMLEAA